MKTWLVSYADAAYRTAQETLTRSALAHGIQVTRSWTRDTLERTAFYAAHREILDLRRGSGYWLWKPFIIAETLKEMSSGDLLVYADAGVSIVAGLGPLLSLCREGRDIVLFANHYRHDDGDDCGRWTKRECFVRMGCDDPRYHAGPMVDASCLIVRNSPSAVDFIDEWLSWARQRELLTDAPTSGPLPDLPQFVEHRHDQSILSLMAIREGIELFRHPSQQGNHLKELHLREPGEWTRFPYAASGLFRNSPYGTLLHHHRGDLGQTDLRVSMRRTIPQPPSRVFDGWTRRDILASWLPLHYTVVTAEADVRAGGQYRIGLQGRLPGLQHARVRLAGEFIEVQRPTRLACTAPAATRLVVTFTESGGGTTVALEHGCFRREAVRERYAELWTSFADHLAAHLR